MSRWMVRNEISYLAASCCGTRISPLLRRVRMSASLSAILSWFLLGEAMFSVRCVWMGDSMRGCCDRICRGKNGFLMFLLVDCFEIVFFFFALYKRFDYLTSGIDRHCNCF